MREASPKKPHRSGVCCSRRTTGGETKEDRKINLLFVGTSTGYTVAALAGFEGPAWTVIVEHVYGYAVAVLTKWIAQGTIIASCIERGLADPILFGPQPTLSLDDVHDLARVVALTALEPPSG